MKKIVMIILIFIFFLWGLNIGGSYHNYGQMFENAKDEFEEEIKSPTNNYEPKSLEPEDKLINKFAHKIDSILEKIQNKLA